MQILAATSRLLQVMEEPHLLLCWQRRLTCSVLQGVASSMNLANCLGSQTNKLENDGKTSSHLLHCFIHHSWGWYAAHITDDVFNFVPPAIVLSCPVCFLLLCAETLFTALAAVPFFDSSAMFSSSAACFVCFIALLPLCIFRYQVWSHAAGRLATQSFWTGGSHVARLRQNRIFEGCMEGCVGGGERWASCSWRLPICRWGRMHKLHDMYGGCSEHFQDHWLPRWTWQLWEWMGSPSSYPMGRWGRALVGSYWILPTWLYLLGATRCSSNSGVCCPSRRQLALYTSRFLCFS